MSRITCYTLYADKCNCSDYWDIASSVAQNVFTLEINYIIHDIILDTNFIDDDASPISEEIGQNIAFSQLNTNALPVDESNSYRMDLKFSKPHAELFSTMSEDAIFSPTSLLIRIGNHMIHTCTENEPRVALTKSMFSFSVWGYGILEQSELLLNNFKNSATIKAIEFSIAPYCKHIRFSNFFEV